MTEERDEDLDQGDEPFETTHVVGGREYPLTVTTDEDGVIEVLAQPAVLGVHEPVLVRHVEHGDGGYSRTYIGEAHPDYERVREQYAAGGILPAALQRLRSDTSVDVVVHGQPPEDSPAAQHVLQHLDGSLSVLDEQVWRPLGGPDSRVYVAGVEHRGQVFVAPIGTLAPSADNARYDIPASNLGSPAGHAAGCPFPHEDERDG